VKLVILYRFKAARGSPRAGLAMQQNLFRTVLGAALQLLAVMLLCSPGRALAGTVAATTPTFGQRDAALEFLQGIASGDPQVVAQTIHPDDLHALRLRILGKLQEEAKKNDHTLRDRMFGAAKGLDELEHLTDIGFYATLADRLYLPGREFASAEGIAAIPDKNGKVQVVVRATQPRGRGKVEVVELVTIKPWGKDWKAALPSEIEAQIDDLIENRHGSALAARAPAAQRGGRGTLPAAPGIVELLKNAEELLSGGKCDEYYNKDMSPNFRRVTGKKALEALINSCKNSMGTREMLLTTLHLVRTLEPRYEFEGQRATYDLSGQGLPFDRFVLEQVDRHWYVAE
jgi:hypothetical protein